MNQMVNFNSNYSSQKIVKNTGLKKETGTAAKEDDFQSLLEKTSENTSSQKTEGSSSSKPDNTKGEETVKAEDTGKETVEKDTETVKEEIPVTYLTSEILVAQVQLASKDIVTIPEEKSSTLDVLPAESLQGEIKQPVTESNAVAALAEENGTPKNSQEVSKPEATLKTNEGAEDSASVFPTVEKEQPKETPKIETVKETEAAKTETKGSTPEEKAVSAKEEGPVLKEVSVEKKEEPVIKYEGQSPMTGQVSETEGEVIKIKVSDSGEVKESNFAEQLGEKVLIQATEKNNEFEVQLEPETLGKMKIKISFEGERISVSMLCSNSKTLGLLNDSLKDISAVIERNTGSDVVVNVREEKENYLYDDNQSSQNKNQEQQGEQRQQSHKEKHASSVDFIQQMRLGLLENENMFFEY